MWKAGGLPVGLPYIEGARADYLDSLSGLIVPGGFYPFPAEIYERPADGTPTHPRFAFERALMADALERDLPTLGICAGMQVMAVAKGATVWADVRQEPGTDIDHLNARPAEEVAHAIDIVPGSQLHRIVGKARIEVNTAHREALRRVPDGVAVTARAPDGVIEAIEVPDRRFALGVQWHPEFFLADGDPNFALFQTLIDTGCTQA